MNTDINTVLARIESLWKNTVGIISALSLQSDQMDDQRLHLTLTDPAWVQSSPLILPKETQKELCGTSKIISKRPFCCWKGHKTNCETQMSQKHTRKQQAPLQNLEKTRHFWLPELPEGLQRDPKRTPKGVPKWPLGPSRATRPASTVKYSKNTRKNRGPDAKHTKKHVFLSFSRLSFGSHLAENLIQQWNGKHLPIKRHFARPWFANDY